MYIMVCLHVYIYYICIFIYLHMFTVYISLQMLYLYKCLLNVGYMIYAYNVNAMHHFGLGSAWRQQRDESEKPEGFKWMSISDSY